MFLQDKIRDPLLDAIDGHFLPQRSCNQDKRDIVSRLTHRRKGFHAGPAREPVIGEHNVKRKAPEMLIKFFPCSDDLRLACESSVFPAPQGLTRHRRHSVQ